MKREDLLRLIEENVPAGADVGVLDGLGVYLELKIDFTTATRQRKKQAPRWPSDHAKSGVFVIHSYAKPIPK
jgi:hypothetical protein